MGAASTLCTQPVIADVPKYPNRSSYSRGFQLFAEGTVTDFSLVWPAPEVPPLPPGTILRVRIAYPVRPHGLLEFHTFVAAEQAPEQPLAIITLFHMRVDNIGLSRTPAPNFGLFGQIVDNPVVDNPNHSPFGDLTGRLQMIYGEFDRPGDQTTFTLLGGAAAGSHATALRRATGSLNIKGC